MKVLSLYDRTAGFYGRPFFVPSTGVGVRDLTDEVRKSDSVIGKHASDYDLYDLGDFEDRAGSFSLHAHPVLVVNCSALIFEGSEATAA